MIGILLDPNMCLSGPKRPFGGPKTDQILIFGPKKVCFEFGGLNIAKLIYYLVREEHKHYQLYRTVQKIEALKTL